MGIQERALKAGVDIIVATPGRLIDHMRQQNADLGGVELLVLDEADRMMDMGFWPDVRRIIAALPADAADAALLGDDAGRCGAVRAGDRARAEVRAGRPPQQAGEDRSRIAPKSCQPAGKLDWLIEHLRRPEGPVLVFSRTKIGAERLRAGVCRRPASSAPRCTPIGRRSSGASPSKGSAAGATRCWSPPTSPRAGSTSTASTR